MIQAPDPARDNMLTAGHIEDIKLAAAKMARVARRSFQAEMATKYCQAKPRRAEALFGRSRDTVALALQEKRAGIVCLSAQPLFSGKPLWETKYPEAALIITSTTRVMRQAASSRAPLVAAVVGGAGVVAAAHVR